MRQIRQFLGDQTFQRGVQVSEVLLKLDILKCEYTCIVCILHSKVIVSLFCLQRYLNDHAYGSVVTDDLWDAFTEVISSSICVYYISEIWYNVNLIPLCNIIGEFAYYIYI